MTPPFAASQAVLDRIADKIVSSRRIDYKTYNYFVWPYKGIAPMDPEELDTLVSLLATRIPVAADLLFTFQTDGEILAVPLALQLKKRLTICRDITYDMPNPLVITQHTRYWTRNLYCERPVSQGVVIVEAIISTGNTVIEAVQRIQDCGAKVIGVVAAVSKIDYGGEARIEKETKLKTSVLARVIGTAAKEPIKVEWTA
jgi:adenine/guanine phosphoribosyltransferase-like PRPP-binding protein